MNFTLFFSGIMAAIIFNGSASFGGGEGQLSSPPQSNIQGTSFFKPKVAAAIADNFNNMTETERKNFIDRNQARLEEYTKNLNASKTDDDKKKWTNEINRISANLAIMSDVVAKINKANSMDASASTVQNASAASSNQQQASAQSSIIQPANTVSSGNGSDQTVNENSDWSTLLSVAELTQTQVDMTILSLATYSKGNRDKFISDTMKNIELDTAYLKKQLPKSPKYIEANKQNAINFIKILIAKKDPRVPQVTSSTPTTANLDDNTPWDDLVKIGMPQKGQLERLLTALSALSDQEKKDRLEHVINNIRKYRQEFSEAKIDLTKRTAYISLAENIITKRILEGKYPH